MDGSPSNLFKNGYGRARVLIALIVCAAVPQAFLAAVASPAAASDVRVRLLHLSLPLIIDGTSLQVTDLDKTGIQNVSIPRGGEFLSIDRRIVDGHKIWILKKNDKIARSSKPFIEIQSIAPKIRVSGYELPAPIILTGRASATTVDVVAALKLDDYLEGVLAGEMPASWPLEALKAQAVAARTYTLFQMQGRERDPYQLEGSVLDQVYSLDLPSAEKEKIHRAVQETENVVLNRGGKLFKAFYHSDCGGQTEDPSLVWGDGEINRKIAPIIDSECAFNPSGRWRYQISLEDLKTKLDSAGEKWLGRIRAVRIASRTPSQRAALLAFNDGQTDLLVTGNKLREILGYKKLRSTLFTVAQKDGGVVFSGRGFGHGSGLCQWGARSMALKGIGVTEILKHYYPTAKLTQVDVADR